MTNSGLPCDSRGNLTHSRLLEVLHYDPATGIMRWRKGQRSGQVAGFPHNGMYLRIGIDGFSYYMQRIIWFYMTKEWPKSRIDHRDVDGFNNRWDNLREASVSDNCANKRNWRGRLLPKGVESHVSGKYRARIMRHGKYHHLGLYETVMDAKMAYMKKATELFGEFARL